VGEYVVAFLLKSLSGKTGFFVFIDRAELTQDGNTNRQFCPGMRMITIILDAGIYYD
jgi:hypothetical protein